MINGPCLPRAGREDAEAFVTSLLFPGKIRNLLAAIFHYSILHLLSVAAKRANKGGLVSHGLLIERG